MARLLQDILSQVSPQEVEHYSRGEGLRQAQQAFRDFSRQAVNPRTGLPGGKNPKLLTTASAKLEHNARSGVSDVLSTLQAVQYLAPSNVSGTCNTCGSETKGCRGACLHGSGRMGMFPQVSWATNVRTDFAAQHPDLYLGVWHGNVKAHREKALKKGLVPVVRHGGTSDIELDKLPSADILVGEHPDVMFNEYTKHGTTRVQDVRMSSHFPNYYFVHSAHERMPLSVARHITSQGGNLAIPYEKGTGFDPNEVSHVTLTGTTKEDRGQNLTLPITKSPVGRGRNMVMKSSGELHDVRLLDPGIGGAVMLPEKKLTGPNSNAVNDLDFIRQFTPEGMQVLKKVRGEETPVQINARPSRRQAFGS